MQCIGGLEMCCDTKFAESASELLRYPLDIRDDYRCLLAIHLLWLAVYRCCDPLLSFLSEEPVRVSIQREHLLHVIYLLLSVVCIAHDGVSPTHQSVQHASLVLEWVITLKVKVLVGVCLFPEDFLMEPSAFTTDDN